MRRLLFACLTFLCFSPASYASFNVKFTGIGYGTTGSVTVGGSNIGTFFVGQLNFRHHYGESSEGPLKTFCIDLAGRISSGLVYQVNEQSLSTFIPPDNVARMAFLYDRYGDGSVLPAYAAPSGNENKWFAALQLAFWKLSLSSATTFTSSLLSTPDTTILNYYNDFVTNFGVPSVYQGPTYGGVEWLKRDTSMSNPNNAGQHLLYNPPPGRQPPEVPAPGGLVLAAAGGAFFGFAGLGRRFRKTD